MLLAWVLFTAMLLIAEPLRLPATTGLIHRPPAFLALHAALLALALLAIACGVIGARGGFWSASAQPGAAGARWTSRRRY